MNRPSFTPCEVRATGSRSPTTLSTRTLRGRLALAYATALTVGLTLFAVLAIVAFDRVSRAALDDRLQTASDAVLAIVDTKHGVAELDDNDRRQFAQIVGAQLFGAAMATHGTVLATTAREVPAAVLERMRSQSPTSFATLDDRPGHARVILRPVVGHGRRLGTVAVWRSTDSILRMDALVALACIFLIPMLGVLAALAGSAIARRALVPLETLSAVASEIEASDLSRRIALAAPEEVERFVVAFNRMLDRLEAAFDRQRRFTADASHEVRTPLSVIRAEADLALMRTRTQGEYAAALAAIRRESDRLERLTRELLATARAESPTRSHEAIDLASTASEATDRFRSCAAMQGATIESDVESTRVLADAEAIDRLVSVLVENALKHGKAEGTVRVVVRRREGAGELTVEDDGPGFSPEALRFGAERFWRGTGVRVPGAGLGLSIAAAIARSCGGSLSLGNSTRGAVVRMRLPLAK